MKSQQRLLSALSRGWTRFPQVVTNIKVREKTPFKELKDVLELVAQAEKEVQAEGGRVLLRYSGTEPKARLLIEGRDKAVLDKHSAKIADSIKRQIGAAIS
jgi:phosphoglucosamine mutase